MFQLALNKPKTKIMVLSLFFFVSLVSSQSFAEDAKITTNTIFSEDAKVSINIIKEKLTNDPDFISSLANKVAQDKSFKGQSSKIDENAIRAIVKSYLIENPEVMIEVQSALEEKQAQSVATYQKQYIDTHKNEIFNSPEDAILGNPNSDITIVEFYDYNCGYCKKSFPDMVNLIKSNPNIRFIMKDFPVLGEDSAKAHIVAHSFQKLMPEKYMEFHKKLLLSNGRANEEKAMDIALSLGADETKLRALMDDKTTIDSLRKNAKIAYDLGINGTPSYIVGDSVLAGAVGEDALLKAAKQ